jgi:hypothetical protein
MARSVSKARRPSDSVVVCDVVSFRLEFEGG